MIFRCFAFLSYIRNSQFTDSETLTNGKLVHDVCAAQRKRHINANPWNTMPLEKASGHLKQNNCIAQASAKRCASPKEAFDTSATAGQRSHQAFFSTFRI